MVSLIVGEGKAYISMGRLYEEVPELAAWVRQEGTSGRPWDLYIVDRVSIEDFNIYTIIIKLSWAGSSLV